MSRRREREAERVFVTPPGAGLECSVCTEVFTDPVTLACGHTFCRGCAVSWFTSSAKRCPSARCPASANTQPAALPTAYALREVVDALRVYCRFGLREDDRGGWIPDPAACQAQMSLGEVAAHEAKCEHAMEVCPFAGCGVQRRRRDADAHDAAAALAHARGERDARLALEKSLRAERDTRLDALEASLRGERDARLALEASLRGERDARLALEAGARSERAARVALEVSLDVERDTRRTRGAEASVRVDALEARLPATAPCNIADATVRAKLRGHTGAVLACSWSPCGKSILTGSLDCSLKVWDVATLKCTATLSGHGEEVRCCAWRHGGRTIASGGKDMKVKVWSVATRSCLLTLPGHENWVSGCAWSPDGRALATAGGDFRVWDVSTGSCTTLLGDGGSRRIYLSCAWSPDGRTVLIGDISGKVTLLDAATCSCTRVLPLHTAPVMHVAWSSDGLWYASASYDATVRMVGATDTAVREQPTLRGHTNQVMSCAWHRNGQWIATCSTDTTLRLWDTIVGNCIQTMGGGAGPYKTLMTCAWSPNGRMLASGGDDKTLTLWDVPA